MKNTRNKIIFFQTFMHVCGYIYHIHSFNSDVHAFYVEEATSKHGILANTFSPSNESVFLAPHKASCKNILSVYYENKKEKRLYLHNSNVSDHRLTLNLRFHFKTRLSQLINTSTRSKPDLSLIFLVVL